jgi:hypothetical protein
MQIAIEPQRGIRGLTFHTPRNRVRAFFGSLPTEFRRTPGDNPADHWPSQRAFAYYRADGALEALEFGMPTEVTLDDRELVTHSLALDEAITSLRSYDSELAEEPDGVISRNLGIALWSNTVESPRKIGSVLIFVKGYYDD